MFSAAFKSSRLVRFISLWLVFTLSLPLQQIHAQTALDLPAPGTMIGISSAYIPVMMKGLKVHPENPLLFDFILDTGRSGLKTDAGEFKAESEKLIKYFLASITIKEDDLWVNLSPYEHDRMITEDLGRTELGRDMLAQDYILKQLTSSLIYPEKDLGKEFWKRVYAQAQEKFGSTDVPVDTFNKVWIVADKARVLERNNTAYVVGANLKVMLEADYLAMRVAPVAHVGEGSKPSLQEPSPQQDVPTQDISRQIIREVIIPEIEKEVNQGRNFAPLRQMFYSMILATWYRQALKGAFLNQVYSDKAKTGGVESDDPQVKEKIYAQYLEAFKKGSFNYIKEEVNSSGETFPRKYFSGGLAPDLGVHRVINIEKEPQADDDLSADGSMANVQTNMAVTQGRNEAMAEQVERAFKAKTAEGFVADIHNDYLVDAPERLQKIATYITDTDPYFTRSIMTPERLTSQWTTEELINSAGKKYTVDVLNVRAANSSARGVPKGGIRALLNYLDKSPEKEGARTASDLMRDPAFRKAFAWLNELAPTEGQVRAFIQKWIEEEAKALSLWMSFKTSVLGIPLGGGKGVFFVGQISKNSDGTFSIADTELWRDTDQENNARISRRYVRILYAAESVGPDIDVPAPDKRTDGVSMGFLTDEYILLNLKVIQKRDPALYNRLKAALDTATANNGGVYPTTSTVLVEEANRYLHETNVPVPELAVFTGKKIEHGGALGRTEATGFGVASTIRNVLKAKGVDIRGKTLGLQGAGNVALYAALQAVRDGMIVQILADEGTTLIKKDGFSEKEILELIRRFEKNKEKMYQIWRQVFSADSVVAVEGDRDAQGAAVLEADVDVLSPCATEGVITEKNAGRIRAKFIVPGANGPITSAALKMLEVNGIIVVPDTLTNARGVLVSYFEQVQALTGHIFTAEEVALIAERVHTAAFAVMWAEKEKRGVSLTVAADFVSAQGIIRAQYLGLIKRFNGDLKKISDERGYGESENNLRQQIEASGLSAYLKAIGNDSLKIRVVNQGDEPAVKAALSSADVIIAGSSVQAKSSFFISKKMLGEIGEGKRIIDTVVDQTNVFEDGNTAPGVWPGQPAWLDEHGNLRFTVAHMPAVFGSVAAELLSQATQALTREIVAGTAPRNVSGLRSGIVVANGRSVSREAPVTDEEFLNLFTTSDGRKRTIGIPKERWAGETRVGATLEEIKEFVASGYEVLVEQGAGAASRISDIDFQRTGAKIVTRNGVWGADVIRKVKSPLAEEYQYFRPGMILESFLFLDRPENQELKQELTGKGVTAVAYEEVRKSGHRTLLDRVFFMEDVGAPEDEGRYILDPMSRVGGYVAVLWAALYGRADVNGRGTKGSYKDLVGGDGLLETSVVQERQLHLDRFLANIGTHLQEFVTHGYGLPPGLLRDTGMESRLGKVVVLGGTLTAREAAYLSLLFGAENVEVLVADENEKDLLERQFRKAGLLRDVDPAGAADDAVAGKPDIQGGIDMNAKNMEMDVSREGRGVEAGLDPVILEQFKGGDFSGVVPVIIRITPVASPIAILGMEASPP